MIRIVSLLIGYGFGLFQTAFIYGKLNGIDIREHGSGNAGTTNALRVLGKKAGLIVFLGDALKTIAAMVIVYFLFRNEHKDIISLLRIYAGAGAILGHNFPFYMKFKGGKGIAATGGICIGMGLPVFTSCAIVFFGLFFITHYVSLSSLCMYVVFVITLICLGQTGNLHMQPTACYELYIIAFLLACMAFYRHRANIKRLFAGNENKTYLSKKKEGK